MAYRTALTALAVLLQISCETEKWPAAEHPEEEPNGDFQTATHLEEGLTFEGTIDDSRPGGEDADYYRLRGHAGFIYRVEFETRDPDLRPEVHISDNYGDLRHVRFASAAAGAVEFFEPFEGTLYFMVTDATEEQAPLKKWRDGRYWLRVTKRWACDYPTDGTVADGGELTLDMAAPQGLPRIVRLETTQGYYALSLASADTNFDKKMILFDCLTGTVVAGSDDLDHDSGLNDPYLYEYLGGARDDRLIVEGWTDDLGWHRNDAATLSLRLHDTAGELEPNDRFMYANAFDPAGTAGMLDAEEHPIEGILQADRDVFRRPVTRGGVARFPMTFDDDGIVDIEIWSSSAEAGGYTMVALRRLAMAVSAGTTREVSFYQPFTGTLYLSVQGSGVGYTLRESPEEAPGDLPSLGMTEMPLNDCVPRYLNWEFPPFTNAVRIGVSSAAGPVALQVFNSDLLPMLYLTDQGGDNTFYLTRFSDEPSLLLGLIPEQCDGENEITIAIEEAPFVTDEPDFTQPGTTVAAAPGNTYIGWFDTDVPVIENRWSFTADRTGTLYLMTAPVVERGGAGVDTVIRLYEEGNETPIAMNDDMIESLPFQNYSFIRAPVVFGVNYAISVKPFMDASSNIAAMNIHTNFALDIRFE